MEIETLAEIEIKEIDKIGPKGLSAYEVYVKNGGTLSETEWLKSLRGEQGPQGEPGAVKMQVVDTLPDTGETDTIYLLKKGIPSQQNLYDEYVYTETSGWEHIGDTSVDLTDYYTKVETDERLNNKQDTLTAGDNITIENNVISASGGKSELYTFYTGIDYNFNRPDNIYKSALSTDKRNILDTMLCNIITDAMTTDNKAKMLLLTFNNSNRVQGLPYILFTFGDNQKLDTSRTTYRMVSIPNGIDNQILYTYHIDINGSWENNVFSVSNWIITKSKQITVLSTDTGLSKTNTKAYTPSEPYNPATKKYVDDNKYTLPVASTETLGGIMLGDQYSVDKTGTLESNAYLPVLTLYTNRDTMWISRRRYTSSENYTEGGVYDTVLAFLNKKKYNWFYVREWLTNYSSSAGGTPYHINYVCLWSKKTDNIYSDGQHQLEFVSSYFSRTRTYTPAYSALTIRYQITNGVIDLQYVDFGGAVDVIPQETLIKTNTTAYTPTGDYNPATKLYTDKTHYENMTGYDATKTQVLKNVSGTLTWVDEE